MTIPSNYKNVPIPAYIHKLIKEKAVSEGKPMLMVLSQLAKQYVKEGSAMFKHDEPVEDKRMLDIELKNSKTGELYMQIKFKNPIPKIRYDDYRVRFMFNMAIHLINKLSKYVKEMPSQSRIPKKIQEEWEGQYGDYYAEEFATFLTSDIKENGGNFND